MTIAGPKGAVTLSIMFTIPVLINGDASFFPRRDLVIFIACGVILLTLLLSNFLLPVIAPKKYTSDEIQQQHDKEVNASIEILRRVVEQLVANQTKKNRRATQSVVRQYNERIKHIKQTNDIDGDDKRALRLYALQSEIEHVLWRIEIGEVDAPIGYKHIKRLNGQKAALKHRRQGLTLIQLPFKIRRIIGSYLTHLKFKMPGLQPSEKVLALREVQIESLSWIIEKLQNEISDSEFSSESIGALIIEYQRIMQMLRSVSPTATSVIASSQALIDVKRKGYAIELETIQEMFDDGCISRTTARTLRDNVRLMQLDLEDDELSETI